MGCPAQHPYHCIYCADGPSGCEASYIKKYLISYLTKRS
jgi:hypothetical protein